MFDKLGEVVWTVLYHVITIAYACMAYVSAREEEAGLFCFAILGVVIFSRAIGRR